MPHVSNSASVLKCSVNALVLWGQTLPTANPGVVLTPFNIKFLPHRGSQKGWGYPPAEGARAIAWEFALADLVSASIHLESTLSR